MKKTKEKKAKLQIIIAALVLVIILFAEIYLMINFPTYYIPIGVLAVVALVTVYVVINAIMTINDEKEAKRNEYLENLQRSDKACYIMLKKSFDKIEERLNELQETSKVPAEEIINAQKGIAKVIINRSKENADAIINSNDQVIERLNQAIMSGNKVVMQAAPTYVEAPVQENPVVEELVVGEIEEPEVIEEPVVEEVPPMPDLSDPNKPMSPEEIAALIANL